MEDNLEIIENRITEYLRTSNTSYAVMLNGKYGTGKTYFYKTSLEPIIKSTSLPDNDEKKYKPIYISLFGKKSMEDVISQLFLSAKGINANLHGLSKTILRGVTSSINSVSPIKFPEIEKIIQDIFKMESEFNMYKSITVCFDDFDRKNSTLKDDELYGYINFLVESGAKVLIIANEESFSSNNNYPKIKEKVVGVTLEFNPSAKEVIKQIIKVYSEDAENKTYFDFLSKKIEKLELGMEINGNNFRHLTYFIQEFGKVFYLIEKEKGSGEFLKYREDRKMDSVFEFSFAIVVEYKAGVVKPSQKEIFADYAKDNFFSSGREILMDGIIKEFHDKYKGGQKKPLFFTDDMFYMFGNLFSHYIGQVKFDIGILKEEVVRYFWEEENIPEHFALLEKYKNPYLVLELEDEEYISDTERMLVFIDNGLYPHSYYPVIWDIIMLYNEKNGSERKELLQRFKESLDKDNRVFEYDSKLNTSISTDNTDEYNDLLKTILKINNNLLEKIEQDKNRNLDKMLIEVDVDEFIKETKTDLCLFFKALNQNFETVQGYKNKDLAKIKNVISSIIPNSNAMIQLSKEHCVLEMNKLRDNIEKEVQNMEGGIKKKNWKLILEIIDMMLKPH